jgi:P4 family phage/plasmid primase-like protien
MAKGRTVKDKRAKTSPENGNRGGRPPNPEFTRVATDFLRRKYYDARTDFPTLAHFRKEWYIYDSPHRAGWSPCPESEIEKILVSDLEDNEDFGPRATVNYVRNLMLHLRGSNFCGIFDSIEPPIWVSTRRSALNWMCFSNHKAVHTTERAKNESDTASTAPTTPDLFTRNVVDYPFDPSAKAPIFQRYLGSSLPSNETRKLVQEMMGLALSDETRFETFFYLYGPTARNGKTVLLRIMEALVGKQNVSYVALHALADKFETWPLAESKINIHGDMRTDIGYGAYTNIEGIFKDLVSGGRLEYQKKGKDKFTATCRSRFVFAGNSLPTFVDRSDAIWERLRIVHFEKQIPAGKRDPNLADKIVASELPGIFNWALEGLARVLERGRVMEDGSGKNVKREHKFSCDREAVFLSEGGYVKGDLDDSVNRRDMYDAYKKWMSRNGYKWLGAERFYARVQSLIPGTRVVLAKHKFNGKTVRVRELRGVKLEKR